MEWYFMCTFQEVAFLLKAAKVAKLNSLTWLSSTAFILIFFFLFFCQML